MFTPSKFQLFPFWVILSIIVHIHCYNDSRIWFNYGNSPIEDVNDPTIDGAAPTVVELPGTVVPSLEPLDGLPGPAPGSIAAVPGLLPASIDDYVPDEQDFSTNSDALDPAAPIESQELLTPPFAPVWWENWPSSWEHYQESNGQLREFDIDNEIPAYRGENVSQQLDVPGSDTANPAADGELHPPNTPPGEVFRDVTPSSKDVNRSLHRNSAQSAEEATSSGGSDREPPRAPQGQQHTGLENRWIAHRRTASRPQPNDNLSPRRRRAVEEWLVNISDDDDDNPPPRKRAATGNGIVNSNNRRFWTLDEDTPLPKRSRLLGQLGTAAAAAASLALLSEAERRAKRERSAVDPMKCKKINPSTGKLCNANFSRSYDLTRHDDLIHTRQRHEIHCPVCEVEKTFSRNDALTRHMRVVHPEHIDVPKRRKRVKVVFVKSDTEGRGRNIVRRSSTKLVPTQEPLHQGHGILRLPDTQPISQEQLVAEVEDIYAGLVRIEAECIEVDEHRAILAQVHPSTQSQLSNEEWQSLTALHTQLLHEYHDFFLASQQPSASRALRRWARKYSMPLRVRRHGIISFLELLRQRLPASQEHMMTFTFQSYSMMTLLYETVPAFEYTWINCLADIARYRTLIGDGDVGERDIWVELAKHWYSKAAAKSRELRGLPVPNLTRFPDDVHRTIAGFLDHEGLIELSVTCKKLRAAYQPALAESLRLREERRSAELRDQWTTRATLALPLDEDEVLETMGSSMMKTSFDLADSVPSAIMAPQETIDDWLCSFIDFDFESTDEGPNKSGLLHLPEAFCGIIPAKHSLITASLHSHNDLTVMKSGEEDRPSEQDNQECNAGDEAMTIDEEEETTDLSQSDNISKFGLAVNSRSTFTQDDEKKRLEIATPSMTDTPTTIKSSSYSEQSPIALSLQPWPKTGTGKFMCPQCPNRSFPRMCDFIKHAKYHTKDLQCAICKRGFSRNQDLVRHAKDRHEERSEQHYCPHAKCRAKNKKPFPRKDNLMKHMRNVHGQDKNKEDVQLKESGHVEEKEEKVENEQNEEDKDEQDHSPGSDA